MTENINISKDLIEERERLVRLCSHAALIAKEAPSSDVGRSMVELCKGIEIAIASIDAALAVH